MELKVSLVDRLASLLGLEYVNHMYRLRQLKQSQKIQLLNELKQIPAEDSSLIGWNNALEYLLGEEKETSAQSARNKLIFSLKQLIQGN